MAQTTQITIDNQTFPSFRSKLNESLSALNTLNSGTSRPSSAVAGTIWLDTTSATNPTLKFYDGADDISLATIDYTANTVNWLDSSVTLTSPVEISGSASAGAEIRLPEDTDNGSNYVGLKASDSIASNITFTLPSTDGTDGQALKTDGSGNLSFGDAGRSGAVNWDTTAKTASFTAVSGNGYFVNTTSGAITVTLPASPSAGDIVAVADYAGTAETNAITIARNGSPIEGGTNDASINAARESKTFVYVDGTQGWVVVNSNDESSIPSLFITATGGTETICGNCKIHTFTGPGTFVVCQIGATPANNVVSYMVLAGGAGGGGGRPNYYGGSGGGAGGFREYKSPVTPYTASTLDGNPGGTAITVTSTSYPITVGSGGSGGIGAVPCAGPRTSGSDGNNSVFSTITSTGGGGGSASGSSNGTGFDSISGRPGGSGGGSSGPPGVAGSGNTPPVSPPQGNPGGSGNTGTGPGPGASGSGGGATAAGGGGTSNVPVIAGGAGATTSIIGSPVTYAVGGESGGATPNLPTNSGGANTGTGGQGMVNNESPLVGGNGGSGIVIIRYKYQ